MESVFDTISYSKVSDEGQGLKVNRDFDSEIEMQIQASEINSLWTDMIIIISGILFDVLFVSLFISDFHCFVCFCNINKVSAVYIKSCWEVSFVLLLETKMLQEKILQIVYYFSFICNFNIYFYHIGWKHHQNDEVFLGRGEFQERPLCK